MDPGNSQTPPEQPDARTERDSKRTKAEDARKAEAAEEAPPAAAATATAAAGAAQQASDEQQQQRQLNRTLDVLFIVLERQRHVAREARLLKRREQARLAPSGLGCWARDGGLDDDGEGGAVTGGGWLREAWSQPGHRLDSEYEDEDEDGLCGPPRARKKKRAAPPPPPADRAFLQTCASAARVCRVWRATATKAADRAVFNLTPRSDTPSRRSFDAFKALGGFGGGVLRALWVRGKPASYSCGDGPRAAARDVARSLYGGGWDGDDDDAFLAPPPNAAAAPTPAEAVMDGLRVLKIRHAEALTSGFPMLLSFHALVHFEVGDWPSFWLGGRRRGPPFFSRANFPSLRALGVDLDVFSDCPLEIAWGGDGEYYLDDDDAFYDEYAPPPIERLRVRGRAPYAYGDDDDDDDAWSGSGSDGGGGGVKWPKGEVFTVSLISLVALAPTLRSLWVDRTWVTAGAEAAGRNERAPRRAAGVGKVLCYYALATGNARPPRRAAPMACLVPCLSGLTGLTSLRLASTDWQPGPAREPELDKGASDELRRQQRERLEAATAARGREWRSAARDLLRPLAPSLARLELYDVHGGSCVTLPPALTLLSGLTCLEVNCWRLASVGPLRALTTLRHLVLEGRVLEHPERHPALLPRDVAPLTALEHLHLSEAPSCLAPVIEGLSRLSFLVLWSKFDMDDPKPWRTEPIEPARPVLRAALRLHERQGTAVTLLDGEWMHPCLGPDWQRHPPCLLDAAALEELIAARPGGDEGHDKWEREVLEGEAKLRAEEAEEAAAAAAWGDAGPETGVAAAFERLAAGKGEESDDSDDWPW